MSVTYMTKQQQAVLRVLESTDASVSACELMEKLRDQGLTVGLTTVYRQLEKLAGQGMVHRIVTDEGAFYRFCDKAEGCDCFLLKCEQCGRIEHLDCSHLGPLYEHLSHEHHFTINPRRTLFYGLCEQCSKGEIG
jgi:Fur family ferric uptake transcriptional regulator